MNNFKFKMSSEMAKIMVNSCMFCKREQAREITTEVVAFYIMKEVLDVKTNSPINSYSSSTDKLKVALSPDNLKISSSECDELKQQLEILAKKSLTKLSSDEVSAGIAIPSSTELDKLVDRVKQETEFIDGEAKEELEPGDFLLGIVSSDNKEVVELLESFNINKKYLLIHHKNLDNNIRNPKSIIDENDKNILNFVGEMDNFLGGFDVFGGDIDSQGGEMTMENFEKSKSDLKEKRIDYSDENSSKSDKNNRDDDNEEDNIFQAAGDSFRLRGPKTTSNPNSKTPTLDEFAIELNKEAKEGKFDPVIGRDTEISQIIQILCCRKKNNAVLLGDPGCGKTAIIEHLANLLVSGEVPNVIKNKRIFSLNLNSLVSGTKYRGEYEERLEKIVKEVTTVPDIIIYIDEFHNLIGNGGSAGNGDAANILKPYLSRGEFQCIGSTTVDEYRKYIEKDGALKRRFQNVMIDEPTPEETVEILKTLAPHYSKHHKVIYKDDAMIKCVEWSGRYISDSFFPDKAISILDLAGSLTKLMQVGETAENEPKKSEEDILKEKIEAAIREKKTNVINQKYDEAEEAKERELKLKEELRLLQQSVKTEEEDSRNWPQVETDTLAKAISMISKIPIDKIARTSIDSIRVMKSVLEKKVIGQGEAVKEVSLSLQRNFLGLRDETKPISSFLMVGPTGVGKSLICKELAKEFFGSINSLIKYDMSEFSNGHEITKLIGSTASYVGYEDAPLLEKVRRNPYSIVLFDEIEKADPKIFDIFLQILDEGYVTLGNGIKVDFKNTIIVFTGNVGTKELIQKGDRVGFNTGTSAFDKKKNAEKIINEAIKKKFRPEFINRITKTVIFNSLTEENLGDIFQLELNHLVMRLSKKSLTVEISEPLKNKIISECDPIYGARDLQRSIIRNVEDEICNAILDNRIDISGSSAKLELDLKEDKIVVKVKQDNLVPVI